MELVILIVRNLFRHKLRSGLTILGIAIAMLSFGMLKTLIEAWYVGVEGSAPNRLVTRNKTSLIYSLPLAHRAKLLQVPGVAAASHGLWYGGIYKDKKNFFPQFAVSGIDYLDLYPEFLLGETERKDFQLHKNAAVVGRKLAERFGWRVGDIIPLQGTIYPGQVELLLVGIYRGARRSVDESAMFFRWDYLNEEIRKVFPRRADRTGWYIVKIHDPERAAEVSAEVDALFRNSLAETLTETEKAFQLGFVAMTEAIVVAIRLISLVVIAIILIVLANTMAMTSRERSWEFAVLKTLGFRSWFIFTLIAGESISLAMMGAAVGALATIPGELVFRYELQGILPVFYVAPSTIALIFAIAFGVGIAAAAPPAVKMSRLNISAGLGHIG